MLDNALIHFSRTQSGAQALSAHIISSFVKCRRWEQNKPVLLLLLSLWKTINKQAGSQRFAHICIEQGSLCSYHWPRQPANRRSKFCTCVHIIQNSMQLKIKWTAAYSRGMLLFSITLRHFETKAKRNISMCSHVPFNKDCTLTDTNRTKMGLRLILVTQNASLDNLKKTLKWCNKLV